MTLFLKFSARVHSKYISDFSNFDFSKNSKIKEIPNKICIEIQSRKLPIKVMHEQHIFIEK